YNGKGDKSLYLDIDPEVCTGCRLCEAFCSYRREKAITGVEECLGRWGKVWPPGYIST
ncbi:MAG: hypothetical protein PWP70_1863, partial [Moorella sp. (in: firmicutes)]|nr:hypothetical protein [Moorella sp. (in: firmicutes)]